MTEGKQLDRKNNPERGIRGIHVGLPRNSAGWLVYIPSTSRVLVSADVAFDEDFLSTVSHTTSRIPGSILQQPPSDPGYNPTRDIHTTEDPTRFTNETSSTDIDDAPFINTPGESLKVPFEEYFMDNLLPSAKRGSPQPTFSSLPKTTSQLRRSKRLQALHQLHALQELERALQVIDQAYIKYCHAMEVDNPEEGLNPADFLPAPEHWKAILKLPINTQPPWIRSMLRELKLLIKEKICFKKELPGPDDPIIPVTAKFRAKIKSDGTIDKLKARICLRGDKQAEMADFDTWSPIASFKELKLFLAYAVWKKCRIYQLDFIGAFLHAIARNRVFTILPNEWRELFPELADWFGVPLRLLKSIYGSVDSSRNWDDTLKEFLFRFGFKRCPTAGSIYIYESDQDFMVMINAVDDELIATNNEKLRLRFLSELQKEFDVEDMGQAHWYLQARLQQNDDYSIVLDQSRYMSLICSKFLPSHPINNVTSEDKLKHASPLPANFVATKRDCASDLIQVKQLEQEYGFQYSSAIGMLIFLLNTGTPLHFAIRKLARFNALPGKVHYKALIALLHHIRTHKCDYGLKFYPPGYEPPIYDVVRRCEPEFNFDLHPILIFCDSSWQDCPDTGRSTGAFYVYLNGSLVSATTFVPIPVAQSSAEAEYNACAFALTESIYVKHVWNFLHGRHLDTPITFAVFCDSKSAITMINCDHVTRHSRHIERRVHFVKQARLQGMFVPYKVPGTINPSDMGTKNLPGTDIKKLLPYVHVRVPA